MMRYFFVCRFTCFFKLNSLKTSSEPPRKGHRTPDLHAAAGEAGIVLKTTTSYYRINRRDISFFRFIFEAYDGIAVVSTVDPAQGIISVTSPPGCLPETEAVIQGLKKEIMIEKVDFLPPEGYELAL